MATNFLKLSSSLVTKSVRSPSQVSSMLQYLSSSLFTVKNVKNHCRSPNDGRPTRRTRTSSPFWMSQKRVSPRWAMGCVWPRRIPACQLARYALKKLFKSNGSILEGVASLYLMDREHQQFFLRSSSHFGSIDFLFGRFGFDWLIDWLIDWPIVSMWLFRLDCGLMRGAVMKTREITELLIFWSIWFSKELPIERKNNLVGGSLIYLLEIRSIDWLIDWLVDWLIDWSIDGSVI